MLLELCFCMRLQDESGGLIKCLLYAADETGVALTACV